MNTRKTPLLAWALCGAVTTSALLQMAFAITNSATLDDALALSAGVFRGLLPSVFAVVAALIVSRQPRNVIGWLLMTPALAMAIPADTYISRFTTAPAEPSPLLLLSLWFATWSWLLLIFPTLFILLLFPTGRTPSARWRWLIVAGMGMCAAFLFFATFLAELGPISGDFEAAWTIPNPIGFLQVDAFPILLWLILLGMFTIGCAASVVVRFRHAETVERAQIKWLLYASSTFAAVYVTLSVLNAMALRLEVVSIFLLPLSIITIPIAIAIAILRYHLWDIDVIIRRTLVYVPLTAILAGIFAGSIKLSQTLFATLTGAQSEATTVLTTLLVVAAFDPIKGWLQRSVDARFKEVSGPKERWKVYGDQVRTFVQMNDDIAAAKRLLEEAVAVFEAKGGEVCLNESGHMKRIHTIGECGNVPGVTIPLEHQGILLGQLTLGLRRNGRPFDAHDHELLAQNADAVAACISLLGKKSTPA